MIAREDFSTFLSADFIYIWGYHYWDAPLVPSPTVLKRQLEVYRSVYRPVLHLLEGADHFVGLTDDAFRLVVEARDPDFVRAALAQLLASLYIGRVANVTKSPLDRVAMTVIPDSIVDSFWKLQPHFSLGFVDAAEESDRLRLAYGLRLGGRGELVPDGYLVYRIRSGRWQLYPLET